VERLFKNDTPPSEGNEKPYFKRWSVTTEPWLKVFLGNLKDFLSERPVKLPPGAPASGALGEVNFTSSFLDNLKDWLRSSPAAARRPVDSAMLIEWQPWHRLLRQNFRDWLRVRKQPMPEAAGGPEDIWTPHKEFRRNQLVSFLSHVVLAILILVPLFPNIIGQKVVQATPQVIPVEISPYLPLLAPGKKGGGGGGGGERVATPPTRGRLPKFSWTQYSPPMAKILPKPKLEVQATVTGPPEIHMNSPNLPNYGDPLASLINESGGSGSGGGIGTGSSGGVGSGQGGGVGPGYQWGTGGGYPHAGQGGYGEPECVYCPRPSFSDEAVKLKYQGSVYLRIVVTKDGRATNIQVIKGLGAGLDQKAVDAVRNWRFKPAMGPDGKPTAVVVEVEVDFHLY
jgi:periplasmic protein TonB